MAAEGAVVMRNKTETLLGVLLWTADSMMRPSYRNLTESYESWAYRNGFGRTAAILERQALVERDRLRPDARVYRLTEKGRLRALGGRDPEQEWGRPWDGVWRMVIFDIPSHQNSYRQKLRRYLKVNGFGCLQDSLWITPDPLDKEIALLRAEAVNVESLILLNSHPCAGETNAQVVAGAWNFGYINRLYKEHMRLLKQLQSNASKNKDVLQLQRWATLEKESWANILKEDPFLPDMLLPRGYMGKATWRTRVTVLRKIARSLLKSA